MRYKFSLFFNWKRLSSQTVGLTKLEKRDSHSILPLPLGLQTLLQCSEWVQSKNGVDLVEVSIFKSEKTK